MTPEPNKPQQGRTTPGQRQRATIHDQDNMEQDIYDGKLTLELERLWRSLGSAGDDFMLDRSKCHDEGPLWTLYQLAAGRDNVIQNSLFSGNV